MSMQTFTTAYAWRIDTWPDVEDLGSIEPPDTVIEGPQGADPRLLERLAAGQGREFQLSDDDGFIYCEGRLLKTHPEGEDDPDGDFDWAPLADYGLPALGAARISYREPTGRAEESVWVRL